MDADAPANELAERFENGGREGPWQGVPSLTVVFYNEQRLHQALDYRTSMACASAAASWARPGLCSCPTCPQAASASPEASFC